MGPQAETGDPLHDLFAKRPGVIKPGLARMVAALAHLGPDRLLGVAPAVLVAGTNGKGTTAACLWRLLRASGRRPGLFSSPHLVHFGERIRVGDVRFSDRELVAALRQLASDLPAPIYDALSFFEVNTLLALQLMRQEASDLDILEVGLGGRFDATNVARPRLSLITTIGLDHQEYLGATTAAIAGEKAGIMRPGVPVLWGGLSGADQAADRVIRQRSQELGAPLLEAGKHWGEAEAQGGGLELWFAEPGGAGVRAAAPESYRQWPGYLRRNFLMAAAATVQLVGGAALERALAGFDLVPKAPCETGRFDLRRVRGPDGTSRQVLLDVCHNVAGAEALVAGLRETGLAHGRTLPALVSILADKDCDGILDRLGSALGPMRRFGATGERAWSADRVASRHAHLPYDATFNDAWARLGAGAEPVVICGSVHGIGAVLSALGIQP